MKVLYWICMILLVIGGLNWGLVGIAHLDLVALIFGSMTFISRIVYIVVGLAAVGMIYTSVKHCEKCTCESKE